MKKKNEERVKELLLELEKIAREEKTFFDIRVQKNYATINNNYWEVSARKAVDFHTLDGGRTWTSLV